MALSPESMPEKHFDFSVPPPSPIASGRRSSVTNDDVLSEFLQHSLRVPDLVLPDKVFPRQNFIDNPPKLDFQLLSSMETDSLSNVLDSIARIGCFQLVNYGIQAECIRSVLASAAGIFRLTPEKRTAVTRSPEKLYRFEEVHGEEDGESEEFVWCKGEGLKLAMETIWPIGYSNFSDKIETLLSEIEKLAEKTLGIIKQSFPPRTGYGTGMIEGQGAIVSRCHIYKHNRDVSAQKYSGTLRYDVIRMLIKGFDYSHALCLHVCDGCSEFHVYSKKGWVSFSPDKDSLVITVGDQTQISNDSYLGLISYCFRHQVWGSSSMYLGGPLYRGEEEEYISMAFLYSPPSVTVAAATATARVDPQKWNTISLIQQAMSAIVLSLVYYILVYIFNKF